MISTALAAVFFLAVSSGPVQPATTPATHPAATAATVAVAVTHAVSPRYSYLSADEQEFIDRINAARTERGLCALAPDPVLVQDAWTQSCDMATHGYFSHIAPEANRRSPMDRYLDALRAAHERVPSALLVGENIYYCSMSRGTQDVALAQQALMASPGHRANILDPRFRQVGVGVYRNAAGEIWVTEVFLYKN